MLGIVEWRILIFPQLCDVLTFLLARIQIGALQNRELVFEEENEWFVLYWWLEPSVE